MSRGTILNGSFPPIFHPFSGESFSKIIAAVVFGSPEQHIVKQEVGRPLQLLRIAFRQYGVDKDKKWPCTKSPLSPKE